MSSSNPIGDDMQARVDVQVALTVGSDGDATIEVVDQVKDTLSDMAIQRQKLNEKGYDLTLSTSSGELVAEVTKQQ